MADTTLPALLATGDHASRPAAGDVGSGALYSCTDHDLIYQSDGSSWTTWATVGGSSSTTIIEPWHIAPDGGAINLTNRTFGAANRAIYVPCTIPTPTIITGLRIVVGTQSGNISGGLYNSAGTRVATSGAVACPANGIRTVSLTGNYSAAAGRYYLALSCDNNTATFGFNQQVSSGIGGPADALFEATAHPLPATATMTAGISAPAIIALVSGGYPS